MNRIVNRIESCFEWIVTSPLNSILCNTVTLVVCKLQQSSWNIVFFNHWVLFSVAMRNNDQPLRFWYISCAPNSSELTAAWYTSYTQSILTFWCECLPYVYILLKYTPCDGMLHNFAVYHLGQALHLKCSLGRQITKFCNGCWSKSSRLLSTNNYHTHNRLVTLNRQTALFWSHGLFAPNPFEIECTFHTNTHTHTRLLLCCLNALRGSCWCPGLVKTLKRLSAPANESHSRHQTVSFLPSFLHSTHRICPAGQDWVSPGFTEVRWCLVSD